jgi:hypothetical protein
VNTILCNASELTRTEHIGTAYAPLAQAVMLLTDERSCA